MINFPYKYRYPDRVAGCTDKKPTAESCAANGKKLLNEIDGDICGVGKSVDENNPISPIQKPRLIYQHQLTIPVKQP